MLLAASFMLWVCIVVAWRSARRSFVHFDLRSAVRVALCYTKSSSVCGTVCSSVRSSVASIVRSAGAHLVVPSSFLETAVMEAVDGAERRTSCWHFVFAHEHPCRQPRNKDWIYFDILVVFCLPLYKWLTLADACYLLAVDRDRFAGSMYDHPPRQNYLRLAWFLVAHEQKQEKREKTGSSPLESSWSAYSIWIGNLI